MARTRHPRKHSTGTHHSTADHARPRKNTKSAGIILAIFMGLLGLAVGFFATSGTTGMVVGTLIGVIAGFLVGNAMDKSVTNKTI